MTGPNDCAIGFTTAPGLFRHDRGIDMPLPCVRTGVGRQVSYARQQQIFWAAHRRCPAFGRRPALLEGPARFFRLAHYWFGFCRSCVAHAAYIGAVAAAVAEARTSDERRHQSDYSVADVCTCDCRYRRSDPPVRQGLAFTEAQARSGVILDQAKPARPGAQIARRSVLTGIGAGRVVASTGGFTSKSGANESDRDRI